MLQTNDVAAAAEVLLAGGVIAYPTETLPGIGCLATDAAAIRRILKIKQRPASKGLIILVSSPDQLQPSITALDENMTQRLQQITALPTTWLLPVGEDKLPLLHGEHDRLAVRVSRHPTASSLCNTVNQAIVSTSINTTGEPAARYLSEIPAAILNQLDLLLTGPEGTGTPSEIRDIVTNQVIR